MSAEQLSYNPLYLQVKDIIQKRILEGDYGPGESIPSEARLAKDFGTSVSTIRQALSILVSEGKLVKKQGSGTFVSEQKVEIKFFTWVGETPAGKAILERVIDEFEARNPTIQVSCIHSYYPHARNELVQLITNGTAPDVAQIVTPWTTYFASMGAFAPLDGLLDEKNLGSRCVDKDLVGGRYMNSQYSVAWGLCPLSLIVNKNCLRELGIENLESPMGLERFGELCGRISREYEGTDKYVYGLNVLHDETDFFRIYTFLQAFGGGFVSDRGEVIFNSPENAAGFNWLKDFANTTKLLKTDIYSIRKRFAQNEVVFITDGPWIRYMLEELTGEPFDTNSMVILNPTFTTKVSLSWNYNHALAVCAQSRNKLYAAKFIDAVTVDPDLSVLYYTSTGQLPVDENLFERREFQDPYFSAFRRQLEYSSCINAQNPMFEKAMVLCMDAVQKIFFDGVDVKNELDEKQYYLKMLYYG